MGLVTNTVAAIEAVLFVAEGPVSAPELSQVLEIPPAEVAAALRTLGDRLSASGSGLVLREAGGGWRLYTRPDLRPYLERFAASPTAARLSRAALEALAVVAYRQPVSRGQVGEIRGVDSEQALHTLERRGLVDVIGTAPGSGQALLYGTTDLFLEKMGLAGLADLPPLADHVPPASVVEILERPFRPEEPSSDSRS
ncbi:MAG TPA: SMC-Scp complex subunit ScpB [Acidimicrobiia bacterium]|nr:SMC-Scp complex subunit ScpB [Acidimicrobiia bacterium]